MSSITHDVSTAQNFREAAAEMKRLENDYDKTVRKLLKKKGEA